MTPRLEVTDLVVRYGAITALYGVSLTVEPGEVVALVGRNGAGKTTLLRSVFGLVRPASGSIRLDGADLRGRPPHRMSRLGLGYVPQDRGVLSGLTVRENLRLGAIPDRRDLVQRLDEVTSLFPVLGDRASSRAATLSGGEQQMLAIARALMCAPRMLLLDEPSLGLAPRVIDAVFASLRAVAEDGTGILLVEQNARRSLEVASRGFLLNLGRIELAAAAVEILRDPRLESTYLGRPADVLGG